MGYHHQNSELWDEVILEVLKRDQLNKSYEIALREFIDWIYEDKREDVEGLLRIYDLEIYKNTEKRRKIFEELLQLIVTNKINIIFFDGRIPCGIGRELWNKFFQYLKKEVVQEYDFFIKKIAEKIEIIERNYEIEEIFERDVALDIFKKIELDKKDYDTNKFENKNDKKIYKLENWNS